MKKLLVLFTLLSLTGGTAAGYAKSLELKQALELALKNNPSLNSQRQELNKAQGSLVQSRGNFLPKLTLSGSLSDQRYKTVSSADSSRSDAGSAAATLSQTLYSGGKNEALKRQAKTSLTKAHLLMTDSEEALAAKVYSAFYSVILARETVAAAQDAVTASRKHVQEVRHMLKLGLANQLELIRAEQQASSNEASLASCQSSLETAQIDLMNLLGLTPQTQLFPEGTLEISISEESPNHSLARAKQYRADAAALEKQILIQQEQIRIAASGMRPSITLTASANYDDPYHNADRGEDSWKVSLNLDIPLYDRGQTRGEVIKARAQQEQNRKALEQKALDIHAEIERAWLEIRQTAVSVEAYRKALLLAQESLRLSQVGYREGVTPQLDLLEALSKHTLARKEYSQSLYNHLMKIVSLKRAEGLLIPWTMEDKK